MARCVRLELNGDVYIDTDNKLQIDIDFDIYTPFSILYWELIKLTSRIRYFIEQLTKYFNIKKIEVWNTTKGIHLIIYLYRELPLWEILGLQVLLDDRKRLFINGLRLMGLKPGKFNLLFDSKIRIEKDRIIRKRFSRQRNKALERFIHSVISLNKNI